MDEKKKVDPALLFFRSLLQGESEMTGEKEIRKFKVVLVRDVLVSCPGGEGVVQMDTTTGLLEITGPIPPDFTGRSVEELVATGTWKIAGMSEVETEKSDDNPDDDCDSFVDKSQDYRNLLGIYPDCETDGHHRCDECARRVEDSET